MRNLDLLDLLIDFLMYFIVNSAVLLGGIVLVEKLTKGQFKTNKVVMVILAGIFAATRVIREEINKGVAERVYWSSLGILIILAGVVGVIRKRRKTRKTKEEKV
jgi:hypothetical protein